MVRSKRVVAISNPDDEHLPLVEKHLPEPFILLDQTAIVDGKSLTLDLASGDSPRVFWGGHELTDISGVWFRRPLPFQPEDLPVEPHLQSYSEGALKEFGLLMYTQFPKATWISDYFAIRRAENKVLQLTLARELGFNVPETIVTSDEAAARRFIDTHKSVVAKLVKVDTFKKAGRLYALFTKKIDKTVDLSGLNLAPAIFQETIDIELELRITVVGNRLFAASVQGNGIDEDTGVRDWRLGQYKDGLTVEAYDLPPEIADLCLALVHRLGLNFGAIDMILDPHGKYWFLENNPNGQWGFVEQHTKQPIGKAVADLLMGKA